MNTEEFYHWAKEKNELQVISFNSNQIYLLPTSDDVFAKVVNIAEKSETIFAIKQLNNEIVYILQNNLEIFVKYWEDSTKSDRKGVGDLSWVTCKQIGTELKNRKNLTFVLMWIEENEIDNISVEASGNPTMVAGLTSRGLDLILKWAEKNSKYIEKNDEDEHA